MATPETPGVILRPTAVSLPWGGKRYSQLFTVEDALRLGADAVGCMGLPGCDFENDTLSYLSGICSEAHQWNVPVLAEMLPGGFDRSAHTPTNLAVAARIGVELGADIIKTDYPENPDAFKEMAAGIDKPIVVLGGVKSDHTEGFFETIRSALTRARQWSRMKHWGTGTGKRPPPCARSFTMRRRLKKLCVF